MNVLKTLLCGAAIFALASCSSPASNGEKYAELKYEEVKAAKEHGWDSEEYKKAEKAADEFMQKMEEKYKDDEDAQDKFDKAYRAKYDELKKENSSSKKSSKDDDDDDDD